MQDNWQEFDRTIGSMLQGAEEQPPRRVWRAVSARLGSAAAAAAWWRWAAPAFAFAALAIGVFFAFNLKDTRPSGSCGAMAIKLQEQASSILMEDIPAPAPLTSTRRAMAGAPVSEGPASVSVTPESTPARPSVQPERESMQAETTPSESRQADNSAFWQQVSQEESARSARSTFKLSNLYAQGTVGGNDSNITYGGTGISQFAPGGGSEDGTITESGSSTYGIPFSFGLGVRFGILPKLSLGTGVQYSLLTRTFTGTWPGGGYTGEIGHNLQYVGIPVNVYYDLLQTGDGLMNLYAWGGGTAEMCVGNSYSMLSGTGVIKDKTGSFQFSAALGLGFEFRLASRLGLFVDPAVRYYFHGNAPKSLRTDKPFMFNIDAGLRFNL